MYFNQAYLEMPNTEAAEALVKAYAETPAKLQEKEISITMMNKPVHLNYTVSTIPEALLDLINMKTILWNNDWL